MARRSWNRPVGALIAAAVLIAGCSSDDDDTAPTTDAAPETTEPSPETTEEGLTGEGLDLGLLAPSPGLLATLFQGQQRGADFAVEDVNAGGGVLDGPLAISTSVAEAGAEPEANVIAAVDGGAQALIGPAGSSGGVQVRDEVVALDSTICSASATVPSLTLGQDPLALFRTAVPDDVTAAYLAGQIITRRDEVAPGAAWKVAIVARGDAYGQSVGNTLAAVLQSAGLVPTVVDYNPRRVVFTGTAAEVAALQPDVSILVTYEEGANLLSSLVAAGLDPATMIGLEAFFAPRIAELATAGTEATAVDGFQMLGTMGTRAFLERLYEDDPNGQVANAPQAYDCAVVLSLATALLDAGDADTLAEAAIAVTGDGVTCTTYDDCLDKLESGDDINYDGVSGQIALDDNGDPTFARFTSARIEGAVITDIENADVDITVLRRQFEAYAAASLNTQIQQALTFLGFYDGPIDGLDSPELRAAIAAFQTSVGLPPTGVWDEATDAAMRQALGDKAEALAASTRETQILMTELGFYTGPIDGIWNQELTDSIKALQRELGVPETGVLDTATLEAIYLLGVDSGTPATTVPPATTTPPDTTAPPATTVPPATTTPPATTVPPTVPPTTVPPTTPLPTLIDALRANDDYSDYVRLLEAAQFPDDFDRLQQYTVFAPTDTAFADAGYDIDAILAAYEQDPTGLFEILLETVALGVIERADMTDGGTIEMLSGNTFPVTNDGTNITVDGLPVPPPPTEASNGIIHTLGALPAA
jgi:ABC-type branched-subunit amino acid transport system substrate-binding protein/peptidoglycan hydrolase-like protein with peptidoglycan-binding domain